MKTVGKGGNKKERREKTKEKRSLHTTMPTSEKAQSSSGKREAQAEEEGSGVKINKS